MCNEISNGFTLPEGYTWGISMENGKKEGKVVVYDEERMIYAELQYHEDKLNGNCCFYEDGVEKEKIYDCKNRIQCIKCTWWTWRSF